MAFLVSLREAGKQASLLAQRDFSIWMVSPRQGKVRSRENLIFSGLKACLVHLRRKGSPAAGASSPKNARDKAAFLSQSSLVLSKVSEGQAGTSWKPTRLVRGTGSDSKAKLHKLATAAKKYLDD